MVYNLKFKEIALSFDIRRY